MMSLTPYQSYRSMSWTSDRDLCEFCEETTLSESTYVEGQFGHYCSNQCLAAAEETVAWDARQEALARQRMPVL